MIYLLRRFIFFTVLFINMPLCYSATLSPHDRLILAQQLASGRTHVTLLVATKIGSGQSYEDFLHKKNVAVRYKDQELGYYRLRVSINKIFEIIDHPSVEGANLTFYRPHLAASEIWSGFNEEVSTDRRVEPRELISYFMTRDGALNGIDEMGVTSLQKSHPTYDGRGVTIAVLEQMPDFTAPEIQRAKMVDGRTVKKIIDAFAVLAIDSDDPDRKVTNGKDARLIGFSQPILAANNYLKIDGRNIVAPDTGLYQTSFIDERHFAEHAYDLDKDGNPESSPRTFAIAKRVGTDCIIIDLNHNDDLRDDPCISDYSSNHAVYQFNVRSGERTGTPFNVMKTDHPDYWVVGIPVQHSHLANLVAAGANFFGQKLASSAPSARLLPIYVHIDYQESILEGAIRAARNSEVDVILSEAINMKAFDHSYNVTSIVLDRIVHILNKVIIAPADNSSSFSSIGLEASSPSVIGVGQFYPGKLHDLMRGSEKSENVIPDFSASGPTDDGRLKPDVIAPSLGLLPVSSGFDSQATDAYMARLLCPNINYVSGIACFTGTSMAGPSATGAVAVLLSAAKQLKLRYKARDIYNAVVLSARQVPGVPIYKQGNGVINIPQALDLLRKELEKPAPQIHIRAPVRTMMSSFLPEPNIGGGYYEQVSYDAGKKNGKERSVCNELLAVRPHKPIKSM